MNSCSFAGRIVNDVVLETSTKGTPYTKFALALNKGKNQPADFLNFTAFGSTAEFLANYFKKGDGVGITAEARQEKWEDSEGNKRSTVSFVVRQASFLPGASSGNGSKSEGEPVTAGTSSGSDADGDVPF